MKEKQIKASRRKYDATFKKEVLQMVESGRPVPDIARSLGVGENLIYRWKSRSKKAVDIHPTTAPVVDAEKLSLQKRVRELEMERDILKKALGIFSRQTS